MDQAKELELGPLTLLQVGLRMPFNLLPNVHAGVSWAGYEAVLSGAEEFTLSMFNELWSKPSGSQFYRVSRH